MIRVNDKWDVPWRPGMTVQDVLEACGFTHAVLVVSVRGEVIPPSAYGSHPIGDGDDVKVIHIVAGG